MTPYPVQYAAVPPARFERLQLGIRVAALVLLGLVGLSLGLVFLIAFLALPIYAAAAISDRRGEYLTTDGPRAWRVIHWLSAINSWFGLTVDRLPVRKPEDLVQIQVQPMGRPTAGNALARIFLGLPSAIVLAILAWFGALVWIWSALRILVQERVGAWSYAYLAGLQRWSVRLLAYQASLIDVYPPWSFDDVPASRPAHFLTNG